MSRHARARSRFALALGAVALLATSAGGTAASDARDGVVPGGPAWEDRAAGGARLLVTFKSRAATSGADRLQTAEARLVKADPARRRAVYQPTPGSLESARRRLGRDASVESVQVSHRVDLHADPQDEPLWDFLWGLDNTGQVIDGATGTDDVDIDGKEALAETTGDPSVVVAVIDDGVDFSHPDLAGQAWSNPGESGGGKETNGVDDDANGYVDDVNGWDFCHDDKTILDPGDYHGTHVAGTIAARLNGVGVVGVAPSVRIMALKFLDNEYDQNGDPVCGWDDQAQEALEYAASFGVRISNNSWGRPASDEAGGDDLLYGAIAAADMLFVSSAGNSARNNDSSALRAVPASFDLPNILSVAAVDNQGYLADFSNFGATTVDIAAPGVAIASAITPQPKCPAPCWFYLDGTSMAAPHVTGVAALVASNSPGLLASPTAPADLKARILGRAEPAPQTAGMTLTGGIVNALRSLDTATPVAAAPNSFSFPTGSTVGSSIRTRVRWPAATDDFSGVQRYTVGQSVNDGAYSTVTSSATGLWIDRSLAFQSRNRFRVRATDHAGNTGGYAIGPQVQPKLYQQTTSYVTYGGTWRTSTSSSYSGGSTRYATTKGAWVQFSFSGRAVAVIAPKSTSRGSVKVYVDGVYVSTVSTYRSSSQNRVVIFAKHWSTAGPHKVKLFVAGTSGHPRFDIDAFAKLN